MYLSAAQKNLVRFGDVLKLELAKCTHPKATNSKLRKISGFTGALLRLIGLYVTEALGVRHWRPRLDHHAVGMVPPVTREMAALKTSRLMTTEDDAYPLHRRLRVLGSCSHATFNGTDTPMLAQLFLYNTRRISNFPSMRNLRVLHTNVVHTGIWQLPSLQSLRLNSCHDSVPLLDGITRLTKLKSLAIEHCEQLQSVQPELVLPSLETYHSRGTFYRQFLASPNLHRLKLEDGDHYGGMANETTGLEHVESMALITHLNLDGEFRELGPPLRERVLDLHFLRIRVTAFIPWNRVIDHLRSVREIVCFPQTTFYPKPSWWRRLRPKYISLDFCHFAGYQYTHMLSDYLDELYTIPTLEHLTILNFADSEVHALERIRNTGRWEVKCPKTDSYS